MAQAAALAACDSTKTVVVCSDKALMKDYASTMRSKTGMKTLFGRKNIKKDTTEGKVSPRAISCLVNDPQCLMVLAKIL